jgi:hypothetical protein
MFTFLTGGQRKLFGQVDGWKITKHNQKYARKSYIYLQILKEPRHPGGICPWTTLALPMQKV